MKEKGTPLVIAIGSVSGGGKTTFTNHLMQRLGNSQALFFDDFELEGPEDVLKWVDEGANAEEWDLTPLTKELVELLAQPLDFVLVDFPFAYQHSQMREFIDLAVFIDTPLDIALTRRTARDFTGSSGDGILRQLKQYETQGRRAYLKMLDTIKPDSDLVIDETLSINAIEKIVREHLNTMQTRFNSNGIYKI